MDTLVVVKPAETIVNPHLAHLVALKLFTHRFYCNIMNLIDKYINIYMYVCVKRYIN